MKLKDHAFAIKENEDRKILKSVIPVVVLSSLNVSVEAVQSFPTFRVVVLPVTLRHQYGNGDNKCD